MYVHLQHTGYVHMYYTSVSEVIATATDLPARNECTSTEYMILQISTKSFLCMEVNASCHENLNKIPAPCSIVFLLRRHLAFQQIILITGFKIFGSTRVIDPAIGHVLHQVGAATGRGWPSLVTDIIVITATTGKFIGVKCSYVVPLLSLRRIPIWTFWGIIVDLRFWKGIYATAWFRDEPGRWHFHKTGGFQVVVWGTVICSLILFCDQSRRSLNQRRYLNFWNWNSEWCELYVPRPCRSNRRRLRENNIPVDFSTLKTAPVLEVACGAMVWGRKRDDQEGSDFLHTSGTFPPPFWDFDWVTIWGPCLRIRRPLLAA